MTHITYSYIDEHGEVVTNTEINPGMVINDAERIDQGINQREAEHHAAQAPEQSPYAGEYPDEGGMFLAIAGTIVFWAVLALVLIAIAQGAL